MNESRYFTDIPYVGRVLAAWGVGAVKDTDGNEMQRRGFRGWELTCAGEDHGHIMTVDQELRHDGLVLEASKNDPIGALKDDINLGELESPLTVLCDERDHGHER